MWGKKKEPDRLLSVKDAAKILHINEQSVRECIKRGYLPGVAMRVGDNSRLTYYIIAEDFYQRLKINPKKLKVK